MKALAFLLLLLAPGVQAAPNAAEMQKIEALIRSVEELGDARFVRNGTPYDAGAAASHLRLKLREAGNRVSNAEDFIRHIASRSSVSGRPYEIVFADGRRSTSEAFLRAKLKALEGGSTKG